ncbi:MULTISPECIES: DMT family transporter [Pelosinus]|uniref:DMT family transporter n=1 Tax=Pelosinus TaxID=365348 RepID=UPI001ED9650F|nr:MULTISPECIES: DMT family transporter [Pelosinus]
MSDLKIRDSFHPYAMITIIFWSLAYVLTRLTLQYFTAFSLGFLRYFAASCSLAFIAILFKMKPPRKNDFLWFLSAGTFGFFFYMITFNKGMETVTASTSSVIIATVPIITALIARFIYKEKLNNIQWIAIVIEFIGVIALTLINGVFSINTGLFWLLLAALALSIYNLLQRKLTKTYTALQTSAFSIFFGTIMLTIFLPVSIDEAMHAPSIQLFYIAILGIFSSAIAYVAWSQAFAKAKQTSLVSNYMFITPFLTSILGFLIANEIPDFATLIGGGIIIFGVLVFNFSEKINGRLNHKNVNLKN